MVVLEGVESTGSESPGAGGDAGLPTDALAAVLGALSVLTVGILDTSIAWAAPARLRLRRVRAGQGSLGCVYQGSCKLV